MRRIKGNGWIPPYLKRCVFQSFSSWTRYLYPPVCAFLDVSRAAWPAVRAYACREGRLETSSNRRWRREVVMTVRKAFLFIMKDMDTIPPTSVCISENKLRGESEHVKPTVGIHHQSVLSSQFRVFPCMKSGAYNSYFGMIAYMTIFEALLQNALPTAHIEIPVPG